MSTVPSVSSHQILQPRNPALKQDLAWFEKRVFYIDPQRDLPPEEAAKQLCAATWLSTTIDVSEPGNKTVKENLEELVERALSAIRAEIDYDKLIVLPKLGAGFIHLGHFLTLLGIAGCLAAGSGINIPGVEIILKNLPLSLAFSMTIIRTGLHLIYFGTRLGRYPNRDRQEVQLYYRLLCIQSRLTNLSPEELKKNIKELRRLDNRLQSHKQLRHLHGEGSLKGKTSHDLPSFSQLHYEYISGLRTYLEGQMNQIGKYTQASQVIDNLLSALPNLEKPNLPAYMSPAPAAPSPAAPAPPAPTILPPPQIVPAMSTSPAVPAPPASVPPIAAPAEVIVPDMAGSTESIGCNEKLRLWWERHLVHLGLADMILGIAMLVTAISGLLFLFFPDLAISGFEIISKDPSLSVSFGLLMLSGSINCFRTGWTMIKYIKREDKRTDIEDDSQLIDLGLEQHHGVDVFYEWISRYLKRMASDPKISSTNKAELRSLIGRLKIEHVRLKAATEQARTHAEAYLRLRALNRARIKVKSPEEQSENIVVIIWMFFTHNVVERLGSAIHKIGKKVVPYLAKPSIVVGILIALFGTGCLTMSITDIVPQRLEWLVENTPLSILFSTGLIISGTFSFYRGVGIKARFNKKLMKNESITMRKAILKRLYGVPPALKAPSASVSSSAPLPSIDLREVDLSQAEIDLQAPEIQEQWKTTMTNWDNLLAHSLVYLKWVIGLSSLFVLVSSIIGLLACIGVIKCEGILAFITEDPSFSGSFCATLLIMSFDGFNGTYRIGSFGRRRKEDLVYQQILRTLYRRLGLSTAPLLPTPAMATAIRV